MSTTEEFVWSEDQLALRDVIRDVCAQAYELATAAHWTASPDGFDRQVWNRLAREVDALGLAMPTKYGGAGAGLVEVAVLAEELGVHAVPTPLLGTVGLAMTAINGLADEGIKADLLPRLIDGTHVATVAFTDASGRVDLAAPSLVARSDRGSWTLSGNCGYVLDGAGADVLLAYASADDGPALFLVGSDGDLDTCESIVAEPIPPLDMGQRLAHLAFRDTPATRLADAACSKRALEGAVDAAAALLALDQAGLAQRAFDLALEHARGRVQFGRVIGSFQSVKHRCADMYVDVEDARSLAYHAVWAIDRRTDDPTLAASLAVSACSTAARRVASAAIQIHGGVGFTWEHPLHRYYKRTVGNAALLGGRQFFEERLGSVLLSAGRHASESNLSTNKSPSSLGTEPNRSRLLGGTLQDARAHVGGGRQ